MDRLTEDVTVVHRLSGRVFEWELCEPSSYSLRDEPGSEVVNGVTDVAALVEVAALVATAPLPGDVGA